MNSDEISSLRNFLSAWFINNTKRNILTKKNNNFTGKLYDVTNIEKGTILRSYAAMFAEKSSQKN